MPQLLWSADVERGEVESFDVDDDRVYVALSDPEGGRVAAFDRSSGELLWEADHAPLVERRPIRAAEGGVLVSETDGVEVRARLLGSDDGRERWSLDLGERGSATVTASGSAYVFLATSSVDPQYGSFRPLDLEQGELGVELPAIYVVGRDSILLAVPGAALLVSGEDFSALAEPFDIGPVDNVAPLRDGLVTASGGVVRGFGLDGAQTFEGVVPEDAAEAIVETVDDLIVFTGDGGTVVMRRDGTSLSEVYRSQQPFSLVYEDGDKAMLLDFDPTAYQLVDLRRSPPAAIGSAKAIAGAAGGEYEVNNGLLYARVDSSELRGHSLEDMTLRWTLDVPVSSVVQPIDDAILMIQSMGEFTTVALYSAGQ